LTFSPVARSLPSMRRSVCTFPIGHLARPFRRVSQLVENVRLPILDFGQRLRSDPNCPRLSYLSGVAWADRCSGSTRAHRSGQVLPENPCSTLSGEQDRRLRAARHSTTTHEQRAPV
jgi:hypothetical protein